MATQTIKSKRIFTEQSPAVVATGIERVVINAGSNDILIYSPIVNTGWNAGNDCMSIKRVDDIKDIVLGLSLSVIVVGSTRLVKYINSGLVIGYPTIFWQLGDVLRVTTKGVLTNELVFDPTQHPPLTDPYNVLPQPVAIVERVHATLGEINIVIAASQSHFDSGRRVKWGITVPGGATTAILFVRAMLFVPRVTVSVVDETGVVIGADVVAGSTTVGGFSVSVMGGGTGVHKMYYSAELEQS